MGEKKRSALADWYADLKRAQRIFVYVCAIVLPWFVGVATKYSDYRWLWAVSFLPLTLLIYLQLGKAKPGK